MKVTLLAHTQVTAEIAPIMKWGEDATHAEHLIEFAGRTCYESYHRPNADTADTANYIRSTVGEKGHRSIAEHASATFLIEEVSRNLTHELVRHRQLSYSQISQRFCDESERGVVAPPALKQCLREDEIVETGVLGVVEDSAKAYNKLVEALLAKGLKRKQAREAARFILPSGTATSIVVSGNHRAWYEVLEKRTSPAADAEIQELAWRLYHHLYRLAPSVYEGLDKEREA